MTLTRKTAALLDLPPDAARVRAMAQRDRGGMRKSAWLALAVLLALATWSLHGACAAEPRDNPLAPVDLSSPRATFDAFRTNLEKAYRAWRLRENFEQVRQLGDRILRTLDLHEIGEAFREEAGINAALYLHDTLARIGMPPLDALPDAKAVAEQGLTTWTFPGTEIEIVKVTEGEHAGEFQFSAHSVRQARKFYELVQNLPAPPGFIDAVGARRTSPGLLMPEPLARRVWELPGIAFTRLLDEPLWKWVASIGSILASVIMGLSLWRAGRRWDRRCRRRDRGWPIGVPLAMLLGLGLITALQYWIIDAVQLRDPAVFAIALILTVLRYGVIAWLVAALIASVGDLVVQSFASQSRSLDAALIRLCFRILSIAAALTVILYAAGQLGVSITPIIAGLGVGGLAVALAIRPTLENIVGGFVLFADKPVRVGEFCSFGSMMGTVEEIGLRSTRLRALDRTVITVPNADFSQMQIVNFSRRDMNLFQAKLGLRYETTPDQLRFVAAKIRKLLIQHSKVSPDPARVRFSEFGDSAYILEVFALVRAADWNEFVAIKEDLNFRIAEIILECGTGFAFPSQTLYVARDRGIDVQRGQATEAEVARWREEKRLPFPNFDYAERAEMADTLPFPSPDSPDYLPPRAPSGTPAKNPTARAGRYRRWRRLLGVSSG